MKQIKVPSTICTTIGCPKATECLRKNANVPMGTPSYPFTPQTYMLKVFLCKGFNSLE